MTDVLHQLLHPERFYSRDQILARPSPVPKKPGIYAWFFQEVPPGIDKKGCASHNNMTLLYVGISPKAPPKNKKPASKENLSKRIRYHMRGNAESSTLRLTLGCLLKDCLGIELRCVGSGKRMTFGEGEHKLSEWMGRNAYVTWVVHPKPWEAESDAIPKLSLPLNLNQNSRHPFHATLTRIRKESKTRARELPILATN